jgi:hypothetical protein
MCSEEHHEKPRGSTLLLFSDGKLLDCVLIFLHGPITMLRVATQFAQWVRLNPASAISLALVAMFVYKYIIKLYLPRRKVFRASSSQENPFPEEKVQEYDERAKLVRYFNFRPCY